MLKMKYFILISVLFFITVGCEKRPESLSNPSSNGVQTNSKSAPLEKHVSKSGITMLVVPTGTFTMGYGKGESDESNERNVTVNGFLMDISEVTHQMYENAQLPNPSKWQDDPNKPVNQIRWRDAKLYCNERSLEEGLKPCYDETKPGWPCDFEADGYRLPTEAEWEYAAKCGGASPYSFDGIEKLSIYSWFLDNANSQTHPVGTRKPNAWGFHGMYGNVSEWCEDIYSEDTSSFSTDNPKGPDGNGEDQKRVVKGGSWKASANMCRASFRQGQVTGDSDACFYTDYCGFRCVRNLPEVASGDGD